MKEKRFTIDDIEHCLNELGFEWVERYVLKGKKYEHAKLSHFKGKPVFVYLKKTKYRLTLLTVNNDEFILAAEGSSNLNRLNASEHWKDLLNEKNVII